MKKTTLLLVLFCGIFIQSYATNLRGVIMHKNGNKNVPFAGVRVDLFFWNGQEWKNASYAITGSDGYYYFSSFAAGTTFCVQIFGKFYPPTPLKILDIQPPYYQDIPTITT